MSRFLKDSGFTLVAEIAYTGLTFFNGVLIARAVGAEGKGAYTLVLGVATLTALTLGFRWQRPTGHFLARDEKNLSAVAGANILIAFVPPLLAFTLWWVYPPIFAKAILRGLDPKLVLLSIGLTLPIFLWQSITAIYAGLRQFLPRAKFMVLASTGTVTPTLVLFLLGCREVATYLLAQLVVWVVLYGSWFALILRRRRVWPRLDRSLFCSMLRYSAFTYLSLVLDLVVIRLDIFLINGLLSTEAVGIYSVALSVANQIAVVSTILGTVLFARVSANELAGASTARVLRLAIAIMVAGGFVLALVANLAIVPLYGSAFAMAVHAAYVMIPGTILLGLFRLLASDIDGRGRPGLVSLCTCVSAGSVVTLDLLLIPRLGIIGAAWANLISYGVAFIFALMVFSRITGTDLWSACLLRWSDVTALREAVTRTLRPGTAVAARR